MLPPIEPGSTLPSSFWPGDERQRMRLRRILLAWLASLASAALMVLAHLAGMLGGRDTVILVALMALAGPGFMLMVRSGWNLRLADPSLTRWMIAVAAATMLYAAWAAQHSREVVFLPVLVVALFGVFRLRLPELRVMFTVLTVAYGVIAFARASEPPIVTAAGVAGYAMALFWLSFLGGRVGELRRNLAEANTQLTQALAHAKALSTHDELTSLLNRRGAFDELRAERARSERQTQPFCVGLIDLDHFKGVNDRHGHATGDAVLRAFARIARDTIRPPDTVARFGGEEFVLILSQTGQLGAMIVAERLRARVAAQIVSGAPADLRYTISCGLAAYRPGESLDSLLARADAALYRAKNAGRNRVEMDDPPEPGDPAGAAADGMLSADPRAGRP